MGKLIEQTLIAHGFEVLVRLVTRISNQPLRCTERPDVVVDFSGVAALRLLSALCVSAGAHLFLVPGFLARAAPS